MRLHCCKWYDDHDVWIGENDGRQTAVAHHRHRTVFSRKVFADVPEFCGPDAQMYGQPVGKWKSYKFLIITYTIVIIIGPVPLHVPLAAVMGIYYFSDFFIIGISVLPSIYPHVLHILIINNHTVMMMIIVFKSIHIIACC